MTFYCVKCRVDFNNKKSLINKVKIKAYSLTSMPVWNQDFYCWFLFLSPLLLLMACNSVRNDMRIVLNTFVRYVCWYDLMLKSRSQKFSYYSDYWWSAGCEYFHILALTHGHFKIWLGIMPDDICKLSYQNVQKALKRVNM